MADAIKKKVAGLWESGVATTVRDLQWLHRGDFGPETQLTIDGLAETALGDSFVCANDRVFLFELKATAGDRSSEWRQNNEKLAYVSLKRAIDEYSSLLIDERKALFTLFSMSHRGHHFVYWRNDPGQNRRSSKTGGLTFEPYLVACATAMSAKVAPPPLAQHIGDFFKIGEVALQEDKGTFTEISAPSLDRIFAGDACAAQFDVGGEILQLSDLGLDIDEMIIYVKWLIEKNDDQDLPVDGILCSRDGTFYRQISSIFDALTALGELNREPQESLASRTIKRSHEKLGPPWPISESLLLSVPSLRAGRHGLGS